MKKFRTEVYTKIQNFLDQLRNHPDKKHEIYHATHDYIFNEKIENEELKEIVGKITEEFKDYSYNDIFSKIEKDGI